MYGHWAGLAGLAVDVLAQREAVPAVQDRDPEDLRVPPHALLAVRLPLLLGLLAPDGRHRRAGQAVQLERALLPLTFKADLPWQRWTSQLQSS